MSYVRSADAIANAVGDGAGAAGATPSFKREEKHCCQGRYRRPQRASANLVIMRSLLPLSGGPARSQLPWHGRSVSSWCRIGTSFVLTYASFSSFVIHRQYRKIDGIAFPITDDALIQMANDDLSVWAHNARPTNASASKGRENPTYHIPGQMSCEGYVLNMNARSFTSIQDHHPSENKVS